MQPDGTSTSIVTEVHEEGQFEWRLDLILSH